MFFIIVFVGIWDSVWLQWLWVQFQFRMGINKWDSYTLYPQLERTESKTPWRVLKQSTFTHTELYMILYIVEIYKAINNTTVVSYHNDVQTSSQLWYPTAIDNSILLEFKTVVTF